MMKLNIQYYLALKDMMQFIVSYKWKKSYVIYSISHDFARIRIGSYNPLPIEKTLTFHYFIILC